MYIWRYMAKLELSSGLRCTEEANSSNNVVIWTALHLNITRMWCILYQIGLVLIHNEIIMAP